VVGDTCPLFEFPDVNAMASGVDSLVRTSGSHLESGSKARARVEAHFTAERIVPQYEALYRRVLRGSGNQYSL
jgi:glycosyltransferase involved in cell wall biosynthesis